VAYSCQIVLGLRALHNRSSELVLLVRVDTEDHFALRPKIPEEGGRADFRPIGDLLNRRRLEAMLGEKL
jgi:hypothetical protein